MYPGSVAAMVADAAEGLPATLTPSKGLSHLLQRPVCSRPLARSASGIAHVEKGTPNDPSQLQDSQGDKVKYSLLTHWHAVNFPRIFCVPCLKKMIVALQGSPMSSPRQGRLRVNQIPKLGTSAAFTPPKIGSGRKPMYSLSQQDKLPSVQGSQRVAPPGRSKAMHVNATRPTVADNGAPPISATPVLAEPEKRKPSSTTVTKHRTLVPRLPLISPQTAEKAVLPSSAAEQSTAKQKPVLHQAPSQLPDRGGRTLQGPAKEDFSQDGGDGASGPIGNNCRTPDSGTEHKTGSRQQAWSSPTNEDPLELQKRNSKGPELVDGQLSVFSFL